MNAYRVGLDVAKDLEAKKMQTLQFKQDAISLRTTAGRVFILGTIRDFLPFFSYSLVRVALAHSKGPLLSRGPRSSPPAPPPRRRRRRVIWHGLLYGAAGGVTGEKVWQVRTAVYYTAGATRMVECAAAVFRATCGRARLYSFQSARLCVRWYSFIFYV